MRFQCDVPAPGGRAAWQGVGGGTKGGAALPAAGGTGTAWGAGGEPPGLAAWLPVGRVPLCASVPPAAHSSLM